MSLAATSIAVERGAHVVRTHDVAETRDAALIGAEFARRRVREAGDVDIEELDVTTVREAQRHVDRVGGDGDGDGDAARQAVVRVFELTGLGSEERGALRAAATETGLALVEGDDGTSVLLVGTAVAFENAAAAAGGVSGALDAALERLAGVVQ